MKKNLLIIMLAFAAQIKSQCFEIQSVLVDACDGGNEGRNEMVIFQVGSTALNTSNLTVAWPNNSWLGITQNAGTAADIATVNATIIGCGLLKEPVAGILPANSKVLLITSTAWNPLAQSFVNLSDTLIVIFQTAGNTAGHFANYIAGGGTRTLTMSFNPPIGCSDVVTYDRSLLIKQNGNIGAQDGGSVAFTPAGVATYFNNGCQAPYIPLSVDVGVNKTICINSTLSLTASPTGNYNSVNWSLGAGATGSFYPTNSLTTIYTPGAGDNNSIKLYCAVIRSCVGHTITAKDSLNVTVNQIPLPSITTSSTTICSGQSSLLSYSLSNAVSTGTTSVQWLPSNLTTSTISANTAGTYSVVLSNACGNNTSSFTLSVTPLPTVGITASGLTQFCAGGSVTFTANSNANNYSWTGGITTQTISVNVTNTIIVTSTNSCGTATATQATSVIALPIANSGLTTTLTCSTTTVALAGSGGGAYAWSGPSIISGSNTATPTINASGIYSLIVNSIAGCSSSVSTVSITQNITPPSPTATNATTLTCTTTTAVLTGGGGGAYSWSGPSITAGGATSTPTVNAPGTYTVLVTATNGCTATANTTITQNITPPSPTATNTTTLTCTTTTAVLTGGGGGVYAWSGPGITVGGATSTPTVNAPGTYTLLVTAANGCTATANTAISQSTVIPSVTMPGTQTITCASPTVSLIGSAGPSTGTALWSGGVCSGSTSFTASACSPNTYTLTVTNPTNGCINSGTVSVIPSVGIPVVSSSNTGSITCTNLTSQVSASTTMTPVSYAWTGPGAIAGATTTTTGTVSLGGTYQCVVTNTLTGCASTITTFVPTNTTAIVASVASTASITCSTSSLVLSASPTGSYSYSWSPSPNLTGNSVSTPTVTLGGTYSVVITNTINGCVGNTNVTVPSNTTIPVVNIAAPSVTTTCANPTITISAATTPSTGVTYSWTAPGTGSLNNVNLSNPVASGSGIFTVVVTNTASGCSSSLTQNTVQVTPDLAIPVTTLSSNATSITCSNLTPSVSITTTASPVSYSWSPSAGIVVGTGTTSTPSFSLAGSYSVIVTNTTSGCATSITSNIVTVILNNVIPTITITPSQTLTCTTPTAEISTTVSPSSNIVYTWAGSGVISSATSSVIVNQAGVYSTTVINSINGCSVTANTSITSNTAIPTVTVSPNSFTTTCASPTVQLTASTSTSSVTYTWTSPETGSLDNASIGNPIASGSGIFTVSVTDASNGCSNALSQATVQVVADAGVPVINLSSSTETITCSNPTPSVAITTTASPVSYSWSPTSGIVAGTETTATPSFSLANTYSVIVTNTVSGCATIVNLVTISIVNTPPVITLSSGTNTGTITCINTSVSISPSVTPNTNLTYSWSADPGISTPLNQVAATFTAAGIYTLAVTNTLTGCVSSTATPGTYTVIANTNTPTVSVVPTSSNTVVGCGVNSSVTYTANAITANGSATYNWNPGAVTTSSFSASAAGVYTSVVIDAVSGCSTTTQFTVTGNSIVPNLSSSANASFPCGAASTTLSASSTNSNVSYSWTGPTGAIITGSTTNAPTIDLAGNYVVTVTDLTTGCTNSNTISVTQTSITAAFTPDPSTGISPLTVNFTNQTTGATSYSWDFGNGSVSTSTNPTSVFTTGSYMVTLIASAGSCSASATGVVVVEDGLTLSIPNVFTPNGDNINDVFSITSTGVKEISLQIFNRWGQKLYEFSGPKASWDGIEPNGAAAADGTYFFFVKVTGFDDKVIEKNGTVNLFR